MTKSLLTTEDVKLFILDNIAKSLNTVKGNFVGSKELCRRFNLCNSKLKEYIRMGMPNEKLGGRRKYNVHKVIKWLRDNNITTRTTY